MIDPPSESQPLEERVAALEAQLRQTEPVATGGSPLADRLLRYLPLLALGNLFVGAPAMIISIAVAFFAFEQADATKKMQVGSVWPMVSYDTGNLTDEGEPQINFNISNRGVGPARIGGMQLSYEGRAYRSIHDLMRACCVPKGEMVAAVLTDVNGEVIPPGEEFAFARIEPGAVSPSAYRRMEEARLRVRAQVCYCSVFDDCWVEDSQSTATRSVDQCPADWVQFGFPSGVRPGG